MALLVAAVFLPYTVHFEVDSDCVSQLLDPTIEEIAKPIKNTVKLSIDNAVANPIAVAKANSTSNLKGLGGGTGVGVGVGGLNQFVIREVPEEDDESEVDDGVFPVDSSECDDLFVSHLSSPVLGEGSSGIGSSSGGDGDVQKEFSIIDNLTSNANRSSFSLGHRRMSSDGSGGTGGVNIDDLTSQLQSIGGGASSGGGSTLRKVGFSLADDDRESISTVDSSNGIEIPNSSAPLPLPLGLVPLSKHESATSGNNRRISNGGTPSSAQEFFLNHPSSSRVMSSTPSLNKMLSNDSNDNFGVSSTGNGANGVSAFIQPKPIMNLRNGGGGINGSSVNDLNKLSLKNKHDSPSSPSLRISRSGIFNNKSKRSYSGSTTPLISSGLRKIPQNDTSTLSISDHIDTSSFIMEDNNFFNNYDMKEYAYDQTIEDEEFNPLDKVTPFGGFSRPDYKDLLNSKDRNVFATAPWRVVPTSKGNGSLKNALKLALQHKEVNDCKWIGSLGMASDVIPDATKNSISSELSRSYRCESIFIEDEVFHGHYTSFCKEILWPIFHYQIPDNPKSKAFENHSWEDYENLNQSFANKLAEIYKDGDTIWVHDYHLMLVPAMVRKLLPNAKIGFFLHVSFPSSEVFRCLAQRKKILEGMLGADCICFQTEEYVRHFFQSCNRLLLADFDVDGVKFNGRNVQITHNAIGIDANVLKKQIDEDPTVLNWKKLIKERWQDRKLIVSRDKIERIRGVKEKLLAYERFLDDNPSYMNESLLILICIGHDFNTDLNDYETEVFNIVERINSKMNNISNEPPIVVINQDIEFEQYLALLTEASLFIVSTLREGMNLTCHEFIVAASETHSPLILSEFVGSANVLKNGAIITNPYNFKQVSESIKMGLELNDDDKFARWKLMYDTILKHDSLHWIKECLADISISSELNENLQSDDLVLLTQDLFNKKYNLGLSLPSDVGGGGGGSKQHHKLFILNLGSLTTNLEIQGTTINLVQQHHLDTTINHLTSDPNNCVFLLGYSKRFDLLRKHKRLQDIGLIAENGGFIKMPHQKQWVKVFDENEKEWMPTVISIMKSFSVSIPSSYIEIEECTVRFHTESCLDIDKEHRDKLVGDLIAHINELYAKNFHLHASLVNGIVIVQENNLVFRSLSYILNNAPSLNTSSYVSPTPSDDDLRIMELSSTPMIHEVTSTIKLNSTLSFGFLFYAGGSTPVDEDYFKSFNEVKTEFGGNVISVKVGNLRLNSKANEKLKGINELLNILSNC